MKVACLGVVLMVVSILLPAPPMLGGLCFLSGVLCLLWEAVK